MLDLKPDLCCFRKCNLFFKLKLCSNFFFINKLINGFGLKIRTIFFLKLIFVPLLKSTIMLLRVKMRSMFFLNAVFVPLE